MEAVKLTKLAIYESLYNRRHKFYRLLLRTLYPRKFTMKATVYGDYFFSAGKLEWTIKSENEISDWHYSFLMTQKELETSLGVENLFSEEEHIDWRQFVLDEMFIGIGKKIDNITWY